MEYSTLWIAFGLTLFAGLSTGIGSLLVLLTKRTNTTFLSFILGFSAGVMLYISFGEILFEAKKNLMGELGAFTGSFVVALSFFGGILVSALIDKLVPCYENPHEIHKVEELSDKKMATKYKKLFRLGIFTALAVSIHNLPEGLITFMSTLHNIKLGIPLAIAIAIHNIPEGIAVAIPIFYATGSRKKAFVYSFLSGLSEPLGALIGYLLIMPFLTTVLLEIISAGVAGIMVFIALDELLPAAREYCSHHAPMYGLILGMITTAISLLFFL